MTDNSHSNVMNSIFSASHSFHSSIIMQLKSPMVWAWLQGARRADASRVGLETTLLLVGFQ